MNDHDPLRVLNHQLAALGGDGGALSPAVYDTAMALWSGPDAEMREAAWAWLQAMQQADGGWGPANTGRSRTLPTLSAILALSSRPAASRDDEAISAGLAFLDSQQELWRAGLPDDLPVGSELVLPPLLDAARAVGLPIAQAPYARLRDLGQLRREQIALRRVRAGSPAAHSFEAWGQSGAPELLDGSGGVGHSPAATLRWLALARRDGACSESCLRAEGYLAAANAATLSGDAGLLPTVWPITRFEQIWALYGVVTLDLLDLPAVEELVVPQLHTLADALARSEGLGMSDYFSADGDDTVTAAAALLGAGLPVDLRAIERFRNGSHFVSYHHELQPSLTTTAHALHALALAGSDVSGPIKSLLALQLPDGRWAGDKWHSSWLYATSQVIVALAAAGCPLGLAAAGDAVLSAQSADGGWGGVAETAYALMALLVMRRAGMAEIPGEVIARGADWLAGHTLDSAATYTPGWIGKEPYAPYRIDATWAAAAVIAARRTLARSQGLC